MNEERRAVSITREDLRELRSDIKTDLNEAITPLKLTLYGTDGRNGIVGDVNAAKTSISIFKWIAAGGLGTGITGWLKHLHLWPW